MIASYHKQAGEVIETLSIVVCGLLLPAAIAAGIGYAHTFLRDRALADRGHELQSLSLSIAEQANRSFQAIEAVEKSLIERMRTLGIATPEDYRRRMLDSDAHLMLQDIVGGLPYLNDLVLIDAQGKAINSSRRWPIALWPNAADFSGDDAFKALASDADMVFFLGEPVRDPDTGAWTFHLARKLAGQNGEFPGLVHAAVRLQYFENSYKDIALGKDSSIAVIRRDGKLLVRYPARDGMVGRTLPHFSKVPEKVDEGAAVLASAADAQDRIFAAHGLANYPIVASAGITVADALAEWQNAIYLSGGAGVMLLLLGGGIILLAARMVNKKLRRQYEQTEAALDNMSQGLCMFDAAGTVVMHNARYVEIFHMPPDFIKLGCTLRQLLRRHADAGMASDPDKAADEIMAAIARGETLEVVRQFVNGLTIRVVHRPKIGGGWVATIEDITEHRRMEEEIRKQNLRFDAALNNMSQGLCMYDATGTLIVHNARFLEIFKLPPGVVEPGCHISKLLMHQADAGMRSDDIAKDAAVVMASMARGEVFHADREFVDGRTVHVIGQPMIDGGWVATVEDITDRLRVERERDSHQAFLNTIVDNVPTAIIVRDVHERRFILVNRAYEKIHGVSRDKLIGRTAYDVFPRANADAITETEEQLLQTGTCYYERPIQTPGRGTRTVRVKKLVIRDNDGHPQYLLGVIDDITDQKHAEQRIAHMARYDVLTDLPNRAQFSEELDRALARVQRGEQFALLYLDLDHFKRVNDTLGHPIGDEVLKSAADRLRGCVRETDHIARLGGDEFAIIQSPVNQPSDAVTLAERIGKAMRVPFDLNRHQVRLDVSIGIAVAPNDGTERDELLKNTDIALYGAKDGGRGIYCFYEQGMDMRMKAQQKLDLDLRNGLTNGEFELYYQPMVNLQSNRVSGCEALLRWRHPERGMVPPAEFIPIAEESGFITPLGEWVLRRACADAAAWPDDIKLAVNLSPAQMKGGKLVETVVGALAASGLSAKRLELEVTETVLMRDTFATLATLHRLRNLGVRISMDDFGTGYSSLSYLRAFPFDNIKIDRSFIENISDKEDCTAIVQAVTHMAQRLNMTTVAEGIETEEQRQKVHELGCTEMQGYLFSRPRPVEDIVRLFLTRPESTENAA